MEWIVAVETHSTMEVLGGSEDAVGTSKPKK